MSCINQESDTFRLFTAVNRVRRAWRSIAPSKEISKAQFTTLMTIAHGGKPPHEGKAFNQPMPLSVLANLQEQSLPGISQRITALEKLGYVERVANPHDRRVSAVQLTPVGTQLLEEACACVKQKLDAALETMGREKLDTLLFLLEDLTCALENMTSDETQEK